MIFVGLDDGNHFSVTGDGPMLVADRVLKDFNVVFGFFNTVLEALSVVT